MQLVPFGPTSGDVGPARQQIESGGETIERVCRGSRDIGSAEILGDAEYIFGAIVIVDQHDDRIGQRPVPVVLERIRIFPNEVQEVARAIADL